jgi:hypothetical protein
MLCYPVRQNYYCVETWCKYRRPPITLRNPTSKSGRDKMIKVSYISYLDRIV